MCSRILFRITMSSSGRSRVGSLFASEEKQANLAHDVMYTSPTHSVLRHDVTKVDRMAAPMVVFSRL